MLIEKQEVSVIHVTAPVLLSGSKCGLDLRLGDPVDSFVVEEEPAIVSLDEANIMP